MFSSENRMHQRNVTEDHAASLSNRKFPPSPLTTPKKWESESVASELLTEHVEQTYENVLERLRQLTTDATDLKYDYKKLQTEYNSAKDYIEYLEELLRGQWQFAAMTVEKPGEDFASGDNQVKEQLSSMVRRLEESEGKCLVLRSELHELREQNELLEFRVLESQILDTASSVVNDEHDCKARNCKLDQSENQNSELQAKLDDATERNRLFELRIIELEECLANIVNEQETKKMTLSNLNEEAVEASCEASDCNTVEDSVDNYEMDEITKAAIAEIELLESTLREHSEGQIHEETEESSSDLTVDNHQEFLHTSEHLNLSLYDVLGHLLFLLMLLYFTLCYDNSS